MSVYVTGDTHGGIDVDKITSRRWQESRNLKETDTLIICGDFGFIWDDSKTDHWWLDWFAKKPYVTCFCCGNHECFKLIYKYPVVFFHGGKAHKINDHLYHLIRGEIYEFDGKKFFCFGGAESHDKYLRTEGVDWWAEEMPNDEEYANGLVNLENNNLKCDYIISHCAPSSIVDRVGYGNYTHDDLTNYFEHMVRQRCEFSEWYFGHYHLDREFKISNDDRYYRCLHQDVVKII